MKCICDPDHPGTFEITCPEHGVGTETYSNWRRMCRATHTQWMAPKASPPKVTRMSRRHECECGHSTVVEATVGPEYFFWPSGVFCVYCQQLMKPVHQERTGL